MSAPDAARRCARPAFTIVILGDHGRLAFALGRKIKPCWPLVRAFGAGYWSPSSHEFLNHPAGAMWATVGSRRAARNCSAFATMQSPLFLPPTNFASIRVGESQNFSNWY